MADDPFAELKTRQREMWSSFAPTAIFTTPPAAHLVRFAALKAGESVLDVGTGTGVVAVTAARAGARVTGLDLTPSLLADASENARIAGCEGIVWTEGDAERLPYPDASFDVVLSQFGHMFAPRPDVAIAEMHRVLKPKGRIAFATWPPEHLVGRMFAFVGRNSPPPPPGAAPPPQWGNPTVIAERLGTGFDAPHFERGTMHFIALSPAHYRTFMERSVGPMQKLVEGLAGDPDKADVAARRVRCTGCAVFRRQHRPPGLSADSSAQALSRFCHASPREAHGGHGTGRGGSATRRIGPADRRPDRRRHLDRIGHSRFPRPARRVDEESGGREAVDDPELPRRAGGAQGRLALASRLARVERGAECRPPGAAGARAARQAARARHPEHRRAAPARRPVGEAAWSRCTAACAG